MGFAMRDVGYGQRCEPPQPNGYFTAHGTHPITQLVAPLEAGEPFQVLGIWRKASDFLVHTQF